MVDSIMTEAVKNPIGNITQTDNTILHELDDYLNGRMEDNREDYEEISVFSLPDPIMQENGMFTIPGTSREFTTSSLARRALRRYSEYRKENDAAMLIHGTSYDEYINGPKKWMKV